MNDDELVDQLRRGMAHRILAADRIEALLAEVAGLRAERGRVPVSWDECADWLEWFGPKFVRYVRGNVDRPTDNTSVMLRALTKVPAKPLSDYRLLPPPGLVAAPSGMDGGGFLGEVKDMPEGWQWRRRGSESWWPGGRPADSRDLVQCRPPVKPAERAVVEVPLTQLVGRVIEGALLPVESICTMAATGGFVWWATGCAAEPLPADPSTGLVRVYAEGDA